MRLRVSRLVYQGGKHVKMKEIDALSSTKRVYGEIWYIMLTLDMFLLAAEDTLIIIPIVGLLLLPLRFIQLVSNQFQTLQPLDARCFALSKCKGVIPNCKQPWNLELCWEKTQCERNRRELTNLLNTCFWQRNEAENFNPKTHKDISSPSTQNPDASPAQKQNSARLHMETIAIKSFAYCKCKFRRVLPMWGPGMHVQFSLNFQAKSQAKEVVNASHFESTPNITLTPKHITPTLPTITQKSDHQNPTPIEAKLGKVQGPLLLEFVSLFFGFVPLPLLAKVPFLRGLVSGQQIQQWTSRLDIWLHRIHMSHGSGQMHVDARLYSACRCLP